MTKIYVQLLDEGTTSYRPTEGEPMGAGTFLLLPTSDYDPNDEMWEFVPGSLVLCSEEIKSGEKVLIARQLIES